MIGTLLLLLPATALGAAVASENEPCIGCITPQSQQQHGSCHAVVVYSEHSPENVADIRAMVPEHCRLFVYDTGEAYQMPGAVSAKAANCQLPQLANTQCTAIPNLGREFGTLLFHLLSSASHSDPPEWTLLIPSGLHKHSRSWHLEQMLRETVQRPAGTPSNFWCIRGSPQPGDPPKLQRGRDAALHEMLDFQGNLKALEDKYNALKPESTRFYPSTPSALGKWLDVHVTQQQPTYNTSTIIDQCEAVRACNFGLLAIPGADVLAHPQTFYQHLEHELRQHTNPNEAYLVEKAAHVVFAPRDASARCAFERSERASSRRD